MTLEGHAEVLELARLLDAEPERFAYLEGVSPDAVRELSKRATVVLYDRDRRFGRIALASRIPPAQLTAWIAQHAFGRLCARITALMDTDRAVALATRMPTTFLADLAPPPQEQGRPSRLADALDAETRARLERLRRGQP